MALVGIFIPGTFRIKLTSLVLMVQLWYKSWIFNGTVVATIKSTNVKSVPLFFVVYRIGASFPRLVKDRSLLTFEY